MNLLYEVQHLKSNSKSKSVKIALKGSFDVNIEIKLLIMLCLSLSNYSVGKNMKKFRFIVSLAKYWSIKLKYCDLHDLGFHKSSSIIFKTWIGKGKRRKYLFKRLLMVIFIVTIRFIITLSESC